LTEPETKTVTDAVALHPFRVPVTVYVVVTDGFTTMLAPVWPVLHIYWLAPVAVRADNPPAQTTDGEADAEMLIDPVTKIVIEVVVEQPLVVPVTEYTVVAVGLTTMLAPV
jgi:Zn-dependent protease